MNRGEDYLRDIARDIVHSLADIETAVSGLGVELEAVVRCLRVLADRLGEDPLAGTRYDEPGE